MELTAFLMRTNLDNCKQEGGIHLWEKTMDDYKEFIKTKRVMNSFHGKDISVDEVNRFGRKAIGIELKESYFRIAVKNLADAEMKYKSIDLFINAGIEI